MVPGFPSSTIQKKNVLILNISGARAIFYYFVFTKTLNMSNQKWKLVYLEKYPPIARPRVTQEKTKGSMRQGCPSSTRREKNVVILYLYGAREILYYFVFTKTHNLSNHKCKLD